MKPNIAPQIAAHLEECGGGYDLASSASIKILAVDIEELLTKPAAWEVGK